MKNPFDYHKPSDDILPLVTETREQMKALHTFLLGLPVCRERSLAITKLEECAMWAIKGLVMNDGEATEVS